MKQPRLANMVRSMALLRCAMLVLSLVHSVSAFGKQHEMAVHWESTRKLDQASNEKRYPTAGQKVGI